MKIKIEVSGDHAILRSPFHPDLPPKASQLGGTFKRADSSWYFDARDTERVKALAREVYGTDGETPVKLVTIRTTITSGCGQEYWNFGRLIAKRTARDWRVSLGEGVVVVDGQFPSSGGSRNNPMLMNSGNDPVVVEVRDVPITLVGDAEIVEEKPLELVNLVITEAQLRKLESALGSSLEEFLKEE